MMGTRRWMALKGLPLLGAAGWMNGQTKQDGTRGFRLHNPATLAKPAGYSHVAEVTGSKTIYIAGQVALDKTGQLVGKDDFRVQARQVFEHLNEALKSAGATFGDVVKLGCFCVDRVDRSQLPACREVRDQFVNTQAPPVSTLVFVRDLVRAEWLIEVEAVAVVK